MDVILLGAGASHGSKSTTPHTPPLGNGPAGLFYELTKFSAYFANLPKQYHEIFINDFELGMATFLEENRELRDFGLEIAVAQYFAQFQPKLGNLYLTLIRFVDTRKLVFTSLNYDMLFELAAGKGGYHCAYGYAKHEDEISFIKPHGSCNFWPSEQVNLSNLKIKFHEPLGSAQVIKTPVDPICDFNENQEIARRSKTPPAMSYYAPGKKVNVGADFVKYQRDLWTDACQNANTIYVIGTKISKVDDHIWDSIATAKAKLVYFAYSEHDTIEANEWLQSNGRKNAEIVSNADFLASINRLIRDHPKIKQP